MLDRFIKFSLPIWLLLILSTCKEKSVEPVDRVAPSAIFNLSVIDSTSTSINLRWQAPGDDEMNGKASVYQLRYLFSFITDSNWSEATIYPIANTPNTPLFWENTWVYGLNLDSGYYFALRAADEEGNWSPLSNVVTFKVPDTVSPEPINDLVAVYEDTFAITLEWSAPGDDIYRQSVKAYEIRYDTQLITSLNWNQAAISLNQIFPSSPGTTERITVAGLTFYTTYYFGIRSKDEVGNESEISNIVETRTLFKDTTTVMWVSEIDLLGDERPNSLIRTDDGGYCIAGQYRPNLSSNFDAFIAKVDSVGELIWFKTFGGSGDDIAIDVTLTSDGGFLAVGSTSTYSLGVNDAYLVRTNRNGELIWEKNLPHTLQSSAKSADADDLSGFVIAGSVGASLGECNYTEATLTKISDEGDLAWEKKYSGAVCGNPCYFIGALCSNVEVLSDGSIVLAWSGEFPSYCGHTGQGPPIAFAALRKTDSGGNTVWSYSITDYLGPCLSGPAISLTDGGFLFVFLCGGKRLAKVSASGIEQWSSTDSRIDSYSIDGMVQLANSKCVLAIEDGSKIQLIIVSQDGTSIEFKDIPINNSGDGDLLVNTNDNNLLIAGSVYSPSSLNNIRLVKIRNKF